MNIYRFPVKRPVTVSVIVLALVAISFVFSSRLNIEDFPKMDLPYVVVQTVYQGAGPEEIEEQVTKRIEESVGSLGGIKAIESSSQNDASVVVVEFEYGTNMNNATADVREKVDIIRGEIPDGADDPVVSKVNPSDTPILRVALSDKNNNLRRLRSIAQNEIKKSLETIDGVASVTISGGVERAILVKVDRDKLESFNIPVNQVASAIKQENSDIPIGRITASNLEFSVRAMGQMKSIHDFENIKVAKVGATPVFLKDIATVVDSNKEVRTMTRSNGQTCVTLDIRKNTDANSVKVSDAVKEKVEELNKSLPSGYEMIISYDKAKFIRMSIENLKHTAIEAAILAIIVVFIFLGSPLPTFVIATSLPVTIAFTFMAMFFGGLTINFMTLVGFILAIGSIVDAAIVVLENIYRHLEMGKDAISASIDGAQEVGNAVFGSVLTHITVLIPMFLLPGIPGQIFTPLVKVYIFAMLCSLACALFLVPMLSSKFLHGHDATEGGGTSIFAKYRVIWNRNFGKVRATYIRMLNWSLDHKLIIISIAAVIFCLSFVLAGQIKLDLMGKMDRGQYAINIETPVGSSLDRTNKAVSDVEKFVLENFPENENVVVDVGQSAMSEHGTRSSKNTYNGGLTVTLTPGDDRKKLHQRNVYDVQDAVTGKFKDYPGASVRVQDMFSMTGKKPVEIEIRGDDLNTLTKIATDIKESIKNVDGLVNLDLSNRPGAPEYKIRLDRKKAADVGLGTGQIYSILRMLVAEDDVSTYRDEGNEYDIIVQLPEEQRNSIDKLMSLKLMTPSGNQVALGEIANYELSSAPSSIDRKDRGRYVSVTADLSNKTVAEVIKSINPILAKKHLPSGYSWRLGGDEKERQKIFTDMFGVLFLAVILTYVFLAVQFESFIHPFTIMLAVPLELIGVFGALLITNMPMTMFTLLGVIMLVGIVISASIVLIDYFILRKESGLSTREQVMEAAPLRLRPILMTVIVAILAFMPLALGLKVSSQMFQPLAVASIGGLMTSTVLTLFIIPVVYTIFEDLGKKRHKKSTSD